MKRKFLSETYLSAFEFLTKKSKIKLSALILIQTGLAFIDLFGVAVIGFIAALSVSGIRSESPNSQLANFLRLLSLENLSFQKQVAFLGLLAVTALTLRTIISAVLTRKALLFLANNSSKQSTQMINELLKRPRLFLDGQSTQGILWALTSGVQTINLGVVGSTVTLLTEGALLSVLLLGLLLLNSGMALITFSLFGFVALLLYRIMHNRARKLGMEYAQVSIEGNEKFIEVVQAFREVLVRNQIQDYSDTLARIRRNVSINVAKSSFMPLISKYVIEITMVAGALLVSATLFVIYDAQEAVAALALFLASSSRIAPSILRLQQGVTQMKMAISEASRTLELSHAIRSMPAELSWDLPGLQTRRDFVPQINLREVSFTYPSARKPTLANLNIDISPGTFVAIVGPSGAGKSTLADLILGVIQPEKGSILISGERPLDAIQIWPGEIGYVPQNIILTDTDIKSNIAFDINNRPVDLQNLNYALETSGAKEFVSLLNNQEYTLVGERGAQLSGGQKQRIGIARALYTRPHLLILDEATSALDLETEKQVADALSLLRGSCTLIVIAHRLSTVRNADLVLYLDEGAVRASGNFQQIRNSVPEFDRQAGIMGI